MVGSRLEYPTYSVSNRASLLDEKGHRWAAYVSGNCSSGTLTPDGGNTNQPVIGPQGDALGRLFSTYLAGDLGRAVGNRMHPDMLLQFIDERASRDSDLRRELAISTSPKACPTDIGRSSIVCRFRFAAMITLESRYKSEVGDSMAGRAP